MHYTNSSAFRRALEDRLRNIHLETGTPLSRIRKLIAFDRFIARLIKNDANHWILKGGLALELRLGNRARTTKDMDLLALYTADNIHGLLVKLSKADLEDFFSFQVNKPATSSIDVTGGIRYNVISFLDGRRFEQFHIDIGVNDQLIESPELIKMPSWLEFANIKPTAVPCYSISQQIAEKFHALTKPYVSGPTSRVKDLIDILLLADIKPINSIRLRHTIISTFNNRRTHIVPATIPKIRAEYSKSYSYLANQVKLQFRNIDEANIALDDFLSPIIMKNIKKNWNPRKWKWE